MVSYFSALHGSQQTMVRSIFPLAAILQLNLGSYEGVLPHCLECFAAYSTMNCLPLCLSAPLQLNMADYEGVLPHCERVLASPDVDRTMAVKARHRRAQALSKLNRLEEALEDYRCASSRHEG